MIEKGLGNQIGLRVCIAHLMRQ